MATDDDNQILGQTVSLPVRIRHARCFVAAFTADAIAAAVAVAASGDPAVPLRPVQIRPGRAVCMVVFIEYVDGDLGPYNEFGVCFPVTGENQAGRSAAALRSLVRGDARAVVHRLPVDGEFTRAAGRTIWGFPKILADFDVSHDSSVKRGRVSEGGRLIADLTVRPGLRVPSMTSGVTLHAYTQLDGTVRVVPWTITEIGETRTRMGGARLALGSHEIAEELKRLRLSTHALMSSSIDHLAMSFGRATRLSS